jgi:hypothetical protein
MQVRTLELDRTVAHGSDAGPLRQFLRAGHNLPSTAWLRPVLLKVALSAVAWFLAVIWLRFVGRFEVNLVPAALTGTFVMFFTLFLLTVSTLSVDRGPLDLSSVARKRGRPRCKSQTRSRSWQDVFSSRLYWAL